MRFPHVLRSLPLAAAVALASAPAHAGAIWSISAGKENGFAVTGNIDYKLFCQDGSIVSGSSGAQPGSASCTDGSNSITWSWGLTSGDGLPMPWTKVENHDKKSAAFRKALSDSLKELFNQGKLVVFGRVILPRENRYAERAVIAVPQAVIRPHLGKSLDQMLADNVFPPHAVLFHRRYQYLASDLDATERDTVAAPGITDPNDLCIHEYANATLAAPGLTPPGVAAAAALALAAGALVLRRRRRTA